MKRVIIFAATRWETNAVSRAIGVACGRSITRVCSVWGNEEPCSVLVVQTGIGKELAKRAFRDATMSCSYDLAISTGYACALDRAEPGVLLVGTTVLEAMDQDYVEVSQGSERVGKMSERAFNIAKIRGLPVQRGSVVTTDRAVCRAEEKRRHRDRTGAIGLDMESAALQMVANEQNIPLLVIRAVSDLVHEDLPVDFNQFWERKGAWLRTGLSCLVRPARLIGLNRLRRQSGMASKNLTLFFSGFLTEYRLGTWEPARSE